MDDIGVTSFVGYNFASFFVLSNIDPVLHGACNVLKRCTTVALAIVMIPQEAAMLTPQQLFGVGFTLVALGVYVYGRTTRSNNKIRLVRRSLTVMVSLQLYNQSILPTMHTANFNSMDRHNFVVWTYFHLPLQSEVGAWGSRNTIAVNILSNIKVKITLSYVHTEMLVRSLVIIQWLVVYRHLPSS